MRPIGDRMGLLRFAIFYLLCGVVAGVLHIVRNTDSTIPAAGGFVPRPVNGLIAVRR